MKKSVLFFTMGLMVLTTVNATNETKVAIINSLDYTSRYNHAQPVTFVERGVAFLVFADGSFDFNTDLTAPQHNNYYYRRSNNVRRAVNVTHGAPGHHYHNGIRGVLITHDRLGRVRRIGNVFINYDRKGRIKRAGNVYMTYRRGLLKQVGGLHIQYNKRGEIIGTRGIVNFNNPNCDINGVDGFIDTTHWEHEWDAYNDDYFYYRKNGKLLKQHKRGS